MIDHNVFQHHVQSIVVEVENRSIQGESVRLMIKFVITKDAGHRRNQFSFDRIDVYEDVERHTLFLAFEQEQALGESMDSFRVREFIGTIQSLKHLLV